MAEKQRRRYSIVNTTKYQEILEYAYYLICISRQCGDRPLPVWGYRDRGLDIITQSSCYLLPYTLTRLNVMFYVTRTAALSLFCMQIQLYLIVNWNNIF